MLQLRNRRMTPGRGAPVEATTPLTGLRHYASIPPLPPENERSKGNAMAWTTPTLVEICIGLEINGYLPAEF